MNAQDDALANFATVQNEFEAQLLVNLLGEHGIAARTTGAFTSQFRAEAPGLVRVVVNSDNLTAARSVVEQARTHFEPPVEEPKEAAYPSRFNLFGIWSLLFLQLVGFVTALAILLTVGVCFVGIVALVLSVALAAGAVLRLLRG